MHFAEIRRELYGFQRRAVHKCTDADLRDGIRNHDTPQLFAAQKRIIVDIGRAVADDDFLQIFQKRKRTIADNFHIRRQNQALDSARGKILQSVRQNIAVIRRNREITVAVNFQHRSRTERQHAGGFVHDLLHDFGFGSKEQLFSEAERRFRAVEKQLHRLLLREILRQADIHQRIAAKEAPLLKFLHRGRNDQPLNGTGILKAAGKERICADAANTLRNGQLLDLRKPGKRASPQNRKVGRQFHLISGRTDNAFCVLTRKNAIAHSRASPFVQHFSGSETDYQIHCSDVKVHIE